MNIFSLTSDNLGALIRARYDKGAYHAHALYHEIFRRGNLSLAGAPEFPPDSLLTRRILKDLTFPPYKIVEQQQDTVIKFALGLTDGQRVESVIIPTRGRTTFCVSSQAGCRMGCRFCATAANGFVRNLATEEIISQLFVARFVFNHKIDNVVFMGMGEPLDNIDNVLQAIAIMVDPHGFAIAPRQIAISTAGHVDGINNLASRNPTSIRLAVSVNAANDTLRSSLMPINNRYPLDMLKKSLQEFPLPKKGVFFIEYVLLAGINDSYDHAMQLSEYLKGLPVRVNLIVYNASPASPFMPPAQEQVDAFAAWLVEKKMFVRIRQSFGKDISAACGQLSGKK